MSIVPTKKTTTMIARSTITRLSSAFVFLGTNFFAFCFALLRSLRLIGKSPLFYVEKSTILETGRENNMNEKTLNKLKNTAKDCASNVLSRVELTMVQSKLKAKFQFLGQQVYEAIQEGRLESIKDDPTAVETVGAIFEIKKQVAEIEQKLNKAEGSSEKA